MKIRRTLNQSIVKCIMGIMFLMIPNTGMSMNVKCNQDQADIALIWAIQGHPVELAIDFSTPNYGETYGIKRFLEHMEIEYHHQETNLRAQPHKATISVKLNDAAKAMELAFYLKGNQVSKWVQEVTWLGTP